MNHPELVDRLGLRQDLDPLFFLAEAGFLWLRLGHAGEARAIFEALCLLCPDDPTGHLGLGEALLLERCPREAAAEFQQAAEAPRVTLRTLALALRQLGDARLLLRNRRMAERAWQQAVDADPDGPEGAVARNRLRGVREGLTLAEAAALFEALPTA